jgi:hypothetical protein
MVAVYGVSSSNQGCKSRGRRGGHAPHFNSQVFSDSQFSYSLSSMLVHEYEICFLYMN